VVTIDQESTQARALTYQARLATVDWTRALITVLLFLPWLAGRTVALVVVSGAWIAAAAREGYESGLTATPAPPQRDTGT
jgi:hypothetical protein